jgi:hypothetical protein
MSPTHQPDPVQERIQVLDVHVVDVLAHLEALLRNSHSIQRGLLQLRGEAPPPTPAPSRAVLAGLRQHGEELRRECAMLAEIIEDMIAGIDELSKNSTEHRAVSENTRRR